MSLQEAVHIFSQLAANPFRGGNFIHRRFTQTIHRTKLSYQQIFPVLTHPGAIVQNALPDALFHEQLMIRVGETMRFVADTLEQTQGTGIHWELQWERSAGPENFLAFFRQADDWKVMQT